MAVLARIIGPGKARHGVPDEEVGVRLDVGRWLDVKVAAVLAHRSEVERGALPGLASTMSPTARRVLLATEWYTVHELAT